MSKIFSYIKENYRETAIVATITLFALILRLILLNNYGDLWLDELYSWYFSSQNNVFTTVSKLLLQDIHMPLYFVILHFWIKLFGQSDISMHLCTLTLTLPLIPLSFYLIKKLFNKTSAYFSAIFLALNTWCMYYSLEVRFYGMVFVLSLLSAFSFAKILENFEKKYIMTFVISHILLIYTFSAAGLLTIMNALLAVAYLFVKHRENFAKMLKVFSVLLILSLPAIVVMIHNTFVFNNGICSFVKDIYVFSWQNLVEFFEMFFSNGTMLDSNGIFVPSLPRLLFIVLIVLPILIGLIGLIKSIFSKNRVLYFFLIPSLMFLFAVLILALIGKMAFLTRYTTIIFPVVICSACYGISLFKWKKIGIFIFTLWIIVNYLYLYIVPINILTMPRNGLGELSKILTEQVKIKDSDILLIPYSGSKVMRYVPKGFYIPFEADDMLLLKNSKSLEFYFGTQNIDKKKVREYMHNYIANNIIMPAYYDNLCSYIDKMNKGDRLIIISYRDGFTMPLIANWQILQDKYDKINLFALMMSKVTKDSLEIAQKTLKPLGYIQVQNSGYSIFVYEKQYICDKIKEKFRR